MSCSWQRVLLTTRQRLIRASWPSYFPPFSPTSSYISRPSLTSIILLHAPPPESPPSLRPCPLPTAPCIPLQSPPCTWQLGYKIQSTKIVPTISDIFQEPLFSYRRRDLFPISFYRFGMKASSATAGGRAGVRAEQGSGWGWGAFD